MKKIRYALVLALLTAGCPPAVTPSDWSDDPKNAAEAQTMCTAAAKRLKELSCKTSREDFAEFCVYELDQGIPLHPQCLAKITVCSDVEKC